MNRRQRPRRRRAVTLIAAAASTIVVSNRAFAAVDGAVDPGEYALTLATQNNPTGFGNNFSELNQALANYTGTGALGLALTGNLEGNGNGLVVFIDSKAGGGIANSASGGFNQFGSVAGSRVDDWGTDTDGGAPVGATPGGGSILAPNFNPDYAIEINAFGGTSYFVNVIDLTQPNDDTHPNKDVFLGSGTVGGAGITQTYFRDAGAVDAGDVTHAFNNSNTLGVSDTDPSTAATATTGFEFSFEDQFLARTPGQALRMMTFVTNNDGSFLSNQFLPGVGAAGPQGNLGGPGGLGGTPLFDARGFSDRFVLDAFIPTLTAGTTWATGTWTGGAAPNGVEHAARLTGSTTQTINIGTGITLGLLELNNPAGYTLSSGVGTINFNGGAGSAGVYVTAGSHNFNSLVNLPTDTRVNVATDAALAFGAGMSLANGKRLTKAGPGTLSISGSVGNGTGASLAIDNGTVNVNADIGTGIAAAADRPDIFVGTPGGAGGTANLNATQHLDRLVANTAGEINVAPNGARAVVVNTLEINGNGQADLSDNNLVARNTPAGSFAAGVYTGVQGFVQSGLAGGTWTGPGLITSQPDAVNNLTTLGVATGEQALGLGATDTAVWNGQTVQGSDTLVMYTYAGDLNLSGSIDPDDYALISFNDNDPNATGYYNGDINYDGDINADDFAAIDFNFNAQGPSLADSSDIAGVTAVPEPSAAVFASLTLLGSLSRKRRRRENSAI